MNSSVFQLVVLAAVAIFLILRLRGVLGTRTGYEKPPEREAAAPRDRKGLEVIEGGPDRDITDHVAEGSDAARALSEMKAADREFSVSEFMQGAGAAYEMILMAFEKGELEPVRPFLSTEVHDSFAGAVLARAKDGLSVEAQFIGLREVKITNAEFDDDSGEGEVTVRFGAELTSVVRDKSGTIVEGKKDEIRRQRDNWTFARRMRSDDPNWQLVATGD